ncbi:hypothetical protein TorRG33x02_225230 [Trema orientale]|uniref:Uncharacterized protein n=1 Tax=Trema orientale TaxID=63057 RepID=A0A2P5E873_TREOI|nr:hypothetical protein TorRG33x02_225230 [Trema orientale]
MGTQAPNGQNNYGEWQQLVSSSYRVNGDYAHRKHIWKKTKSITRSSSRYWTTSIHSKAQNAIANVFAKDFSAFAKPYNQRLGHLRFKYHHKNSKSGAACDLAQLKK